MTTTQPNEAGSPPQAETPFDTIVIGAGFGGMYALHRLRSAGVNAIAIEAGDDVGGTWFWNRYPGARCDIRSAEYSYSFDKELEQSWKWSERFAAQPEILAYAQHVADRFNLREDIRFNTKVIRAQWDDALSLWTVHTDNGNTLRARFCIWATGPLSVPKMPDIPGVDSFAGEVLVTGVWPKEPVSLAGKRVGVVGTGSSGIQVVTSIADSVGELFVFQRTPSFSLPAQNYKVTPELDQEIKADYARIRATARSRRNGQDTQHVGKELLALPDAERQEYLEKLWEHGGIGLQSAFTDVMFDRRANEVVAEFVRQKVRGMIKNQATAEAMLPGAHPFGSRRVCIDTGYYDRFNLDRVHLVDTLRNPIQEVTSAGIRTSAEEVQLDVLILATGFDAMTGALTQIDICSADGTTLRDVWAKEGTATYLGLMVANFPNMFIVNGPGSPSVMMNVILALEHHVDLIMDLLQAVRDAGDASILQVDAQAQADWSNHVADIAEGTLFADSNSWYSGANIPGKRRAFLPYIGGFPRFQEEVSEIFADGRRGFIISEHANA